jgi:hypothetical protein
VNAWYNVLGGRGRRLGEFVEGDRHREIDPYRTQVGIATGRLELWIVGRVLTGIAVVGAAVALLVHLARSLRPRPDGVISLQEPA